MKLRYNNAIHLQARSVFKSHWNSYLQQRNQLNDIVYIYNITVTAFKTYYFWHIVIICIICLAGFRSWHLPSILLVISKKHNSFKKNRHSRHLTQTQMTAQLFEMQVSGLYCQNIDFCSLSYHILFTNKIDLSTEWH